MRHRVFCASLADVMEDRPELHLWRERLWRLVQQCHGLDWLLLTKRPENFARFLPWSLASRPDAAWPHVWLGVSVEDQARADERIPLLLETPAAVRFLSCEPLIGPVNLRPWLEHDDFGFCNACGRTGRLRDGDTCWSCGDVRTRPGRSGLGWVIVGGESGPGARPCRLDWVRSLVRQCREAGVACFVKQLGAHPVETVQQGPVHLERQSPGTRVSLRIGETAFSRERWLRHPKGGDPAEWPEDLRVREYPEVNVLGGS